MKYIIVNQMGVEVPILFNDILDHNVVAGNQKVVSAGKVSLVVMDGIEASCYGGSTTLQMKSRGEEDSEIIQRTIKSY